MRRPLARFVSGYIHKKSLARGFDPASVVARRREGDCTEHAVLLAALARAFGLPARVVLGLALVEEKDGLAAYGHVWVEVRGRDGWTPHDAAVDPKVRRAYLPMTLLEDEGPGFGASAAERSGVVDVRRLVIH
jgi:transglutaminase-like putative cysteine protease